MVEPLQRLAAIFHPRILELMSFGAAGQLAAAAATLAVADAALEAACVRMRSTTVNSPARTFH